MCILPPHQPLCYNPSHISPFSLDFPAHMPDTLPDSVRWLAALLEGSTLPPEEAIRGLLGLLEDAFGILALFPSTGDAVPLEWYFAPAVPPAVREWVQAPLLVEGLQRAFHRGETLAFPPPACETWEGRPLFLEEDAPLEGIVVLPVEHREYRLGLLIAAYPRMATPLSCGSLARLRSLGRALAWPAFIQNLAAEKRYLQEQIEAFQYRKDEFIAITSHELRTPLGLVLGHATFLQATAAEPSLQEHVDVIIQSAIRIKEIIETATQADNYQTGTARLRVHTVNLNTLVKSLCEVFREEAESKGIRLHTATPTPPLVLDGDPEKIRIILKNLIENALTFTDSGRNVWVSLTQVGGYAQIKVRDEGIGIPPNALAHVFERFYQVEGHLTRHHNGMGLGLSVARDLAQLHGGRIEAESEEGKGSCFTLYLPLEQAGAEEVPESTLSKP